jgi:malonate-semialdehyde dehydrogenase (acetylating) / methylmalonate-semialdehyde dehydrogenase
MTVNLKSNAQLQVPMWTFPIAVVIGNCFILKPSEKVPLTMRRVAALMEEAGFPPGVFGMVQGTQSAVQALIQHPNVRAVTFVGSSPVAELVSGSCRALHKRCTSLGGAKNHLVALADCDVTTAASDICVSFAGCAGQRCMAASVLLTVGPHPSLVETIVQAAAALQVQGHYLLNPEILR